MTVESARRGGLVGELLLAIPPTGVVLATVLLVETLRHERILFASLASSAFLIYRDPRHPMKGVRVMVAAHIVGVALGVGARWLLGPGYAAGALAMIATILILVLGKIVHPPAVSTALGFAFFTPQPGAAALFLLALVMLAVLVGLQRAALWTLPRLDRHTTHDRPET